MSNIESLLTALLNGESVDIEPQSRIELYLKNCCEKCGSEGLPVPVSRVDALLYQLSEQLAGGGGSGGGITPEGTLNITENGEYDVTTFEKANVNVASSGGGGEEWIGDGNTYIWITLQEGRTSPMLGVCPKGTVTVDWGDGTTPDVLTGTSVTSVKWTPTHEYATAGDYVIKLTVDGEMGFYGSFSTNQYSAILRHSSGEDVRNQIYQNSVQKVEMSNNVTSIGVNAFLSCQSLTSITIPDGVTSIKSGAFKSCYSLTSITIPDGVTSIESTAFQTCQSLTSITIPDGVTSIGSMAFNNCYLLTSITIPDSVTSIGSDAFKNCQLLTSITIPDSVTSIVSGAFDFCYSLTSITIPDGVTSIGAYTFRNCTGMRYYDFTKHTSVPTLASTTAFYGIPADCEIGVPPALYDEWIAATNWSTLANQIVAR